MSRSPSFPMRFQMADSVEIGLHVSRRDERQRRQRHRLSVNATPWDYASLVDVVRWEPGF